MRTRRILQTVAGVALACGFASDVLATPFGYVRLDFQTHVVSNNVGGGGVWGAKILQYASNSNLDSLSLDLQVLGPVFTEALNNLAYIICIEKDQTINVNNSYQDPSWYAMYRGLDGLPSGTADITSDENTVIERVLTGEFGLNFEDKDTSNSPDRTALVQGLQALIWEAGKTGSDADDFADGSVNTLSSGNALAQSWITDPHPNYRTSGLDTVTAYGLQAVILLQDGTFTDSGRQDFAGYGPSIDEGDTVPAPAPILLIGLGLLGMFGLNRRRS